MLINTIYVLSQKIVYIKWEIQWKNILINNEKCVICI